MTDPDPLFKALWDASVTDVTAFIATLDQAVESFGGDLTFSAAALAKHLCEVSPDPKWLATRLAVALHLMNAATMPVADRWAQQVVDKLKEQL